MFVGATYGGFHPAGEPWLRSAPADDTAATLVTSRPERSPLTDNAPDEFREAVRTASYGRQCAVVLTTTVARDRARRLVVPAGGVSVRNRRLRVETRSDGPGEPLPDGGRVGYTGVILVNLEGSPAPRRLVVSFPEGTVTAMNSS